MILFKLALLSIVDSERCYDASEVARSASEKRRLPAGAAAQAGEENQFIAGLSAWHGLCMAGRLACY